MNTDHRRATVLFQQPQQHASRDASRRSALITLSAQLVASVVGFSLGLAAYLFTSNIKSGSFWSHISPLVAVIFLYVGVGGKNHGKVWIVVGLVFEGITVLLCFIGCIIDAVTAGHVVDTNFDSCAYSESGGTANCDNPVKYILLFKPCRMTFSENSCYCCEIFKKHNCDEFGFGLSTQPDEYIGVSSCDDVSGSYNIFLWSSMIFCLLNFMLAIAVFATIGQFVHTIKSVSPSSIPCAQTTGTLANRTTMMSYNHSSDIIFYPSGAVGYRAGVTEQMFQVPEYSPRGNFVPTEPPPYEPRTLTPVETRGGPLTEADGSRNHPMPDLPPSYSSLY